jgi:hypothetical protein
MQQQQRPTGTLVLSGKKRALLPPQEESAPKKRKQGGGAAKSEQVIRMLYDALEERRKDVFYNLMDGAQPEFIWRYVEDLPNVIYDTYKTERLRAMHNSVDPRGGLMPEDREILRMCTHKKDAILQHALLFFALYALPNFTNYFFKGNRERGEPPPFVANPDLLRHFVNKYVTARSTELVNGKYETSSMMMAPRSPIETYVFNLRVDYITTCGMYRPAEFVEVPFRFILKPPRPRALAGAIAPPAATPPARREEQRQESVSSAAPAAVPQKIVLEQKIVFTDRHQEFEELNARAQNWKTFRLRVQSYQHDRMLDLKEQSEKIKKPAAMRKTPLSSGLVANSSTANDTVENERELGLAAARQQHREKTFVDPEDIYDG